MSDYPGTRTLITSDETLIDATNQVIASSDASFINQTLMSIRAYVLSHKGEISVLTLDTVLDALDTMKVTPTMAGVSKALKYVKQALRDCMFPHNT